ncbi:MAG: DUF47 family protein [Candidatus Lokiarchaeota archaeon]|nr:DUF47 family protein [Candidatus Lokiarchaeota archaeon]MBD3341500.1 DUF47 family protein [Candidatus Lokiarchaeota archaeon]
MSSLSEWFKSRNEESVINQSLVHMQKILECVVEFEKGLSFFLEEHKMELAMKVFRRVEQLEHQADVIRRKILNKISKAEIVPTIRENLVHLIKRIDDIANATNACARILLYINQEDFLNLGKEIHAKILEMVRISVEAVKKVNIMVNKLLSVEEVEILNLGEEVNIMEHKCDEIRADISKILVTNHPAINPFSAIEIHNCITILEAISDNAEDVADYIIMLRVAKRT